MNLKWLTVRYSLLAGFIALFPHGTRIYNMWLSPSGYMLAWYEFVVFVISAVVLTLMLFVGGWTIEEGQRDMFFYLLPVLTFVVVVVLVWPIAWRIEDRVRVRGFQEVVLAFEPLAEAVVAFEDDNGRLPSTLNELVPEYLSEVPVAHKDMMFRVQLVNPDTAGIRYDEPWAIRASAHIMFFDDLELLYLPSQQYPDHLHQFNGWGFFYE